MKNLLLVLSLAFSFNASAEGVTPKERCLLLHAVAKYSYYLRQDGATKSDAHSAVSILTSKLYDGDASAVTDGAITLAYMAKLGKGEKHAEKFANGLYRQCVEMASKRGRKQ